MHYGTPPRRGCSPPEPISKPPNGFSAIRRPASCCGHTLMLSKAVVGQPWTPSRRLSGKLKRPNNHNWLPNWLPSSREASLVGRVRKTSNQDNSWVFRNRTQSSGTKNRVRIPLGLPLKTSLRRGFFILSTFRGAALTQSRRDKTRKSETNETDRRNRGRGLSGRPLFPIPYRSYIRPHRNRYCYSLLTRCGQL